mmetsp:Transcript_108647/g.324925  ORF Transcript_108647/g.324925 Transcript_108647/m.324925 type:complete len:270 (-) Transcript_108647:97-906(-)
MSKEIPTMTKEQVIEMEELLMVEYKKREFQDLLHKAWKDAQGDVMGRMKKRQELTLPIQIPIITRYGFEGSKKGLAQSTAAVQSCPDQTEEMLRNHQILMWLCDPDEQKARPDFVPDAEIPEELKPAKQTIYPEDLVARKSHWVVVGGQGKGGLVVRKGKALDSPFYNFRLATGARIMAETDITSKRMHYRKITGDGPDFGWISLVAPPNKADKENEPKPFKGMLVVPEGVELTDELYEQLAKITFEAEAKASTRFNPPEASELLALEN